MSDNDREKGDDQEDKGTLGKTTVIFCKVPQSQEKMEQHLLQGDVGEGSTKVVPHKRKPEEVEQQQEHGKGQDVDVADISGQAEEKEKNWTLKVPPEMWVKILNQINCTNELVQLRGVSKYFKTIVDEHKSFVVRMNGQDRKTFPGPHVIKHKIEIRNFFSPMTTAEGIETFHRLEKLQHFVMKGPIHSSVAQHVLSCATNLKIVQMNSVSFELHQPGPIPSVGQLNKLETIIFYHPDSYNFLEEEGEEFDAHFSPAEVKTMDCFAVVISGMLRPPIKLPVLTKLSIEYDDLPLDLIYDLCENTIIPFIQGHGETLTYLKIKLASDFFEDIFDQMSDDEDGVSDNDEDAASDEEAPPGNVNPSAQPLGTIGMRKLVEIYLTLPDASLNDVLKSLFRSKDSISMNTLQKCTLDWNAPFPAALVTDAWETIHSLLRNNSESLIHVVLEGVDAEHCLFNDTHGNQFSITFESLTNLKISTRIYEDGFVVPPVNVQHRLVVQQFPSVTHISLSNIGVELRAFQTWLMASCPELKHLELDELDYDNDQGIDKEFLEMLLRKPGLETIKIEISDLTTPWDDPYWDNVKAIPVEHVQVDNEDFLNIRLNRI